MNILTRWFAFAPMVLGASAASAQGPAADRVAVERAAASYLRTVITERPIGFDGATSSIGVSQDVGDRSASHVASLAQLLDGSPMKAAAAIACSGYSPRSCKINNAKALVRIGVPHIKGDSAEVAFYSRKMTDDSRQPVHAFDGTILLVRRDGTWRAVGVTKARVT